MGKIKILEPGLCTTVQDRGRTGYQRYGMPESGAMDEFSYKIANSLVDNNENAPALEFTLNGPKIKFLDNCIIALTGAVSQAYLNQCQIPAWQSIYVPAGAVLSIKNFKKGVRGYLSFKGGLKVEEVLNSCSTYLRGNLGGYLGRRLKENDQLEFAYNSDKSNYKFRYLADEYIPEYKSQVECRVVMGPQAEWFSKDGIKTFLNSIYTVTDQADRMGYRLEGPEIEHSKGSDIISDGIPEGSIQVPGHQQPIVMLADRQTTGGYPKIATVIAVDIAKIAQLKPGDKVSFKQVEIEEAHKLLQDRGKIYQQIV
ncbi:MAG: biotin-dependent carboxyltransferase family protein, partial [Bacillota bacterium]